MQHARVKNLIRDALGPDASACADDVVYVVTQAFGPCLQWSVQCQSHELSAVVRQRVEAIQDADGPRSVRAEAAVWTTSASEDWRFVAGDYTLRVVRCGSN
jgi:hypothetical protein